MAATLLAIAAGCAPYQSATVPPPVPVLTPPTAPAVPAPAAPPVEPAAPIVREIPSPMRLQDRVAVILQPEESIAPIRSEVIIVASVLGSDGYLRTNEPVHWHLDPNGVGQIVDVCPGSFADLLVGDFTRPRKVSNHYAVTSTSRRYLLLTRGTVNPDDDLSVMPGQTWVSITSAVEGTSLLTAFAPGVRDWTRRTQTARIHWIDAQWTVPAPVIVPAGSRHQLVTVVTRQSDRAPIAGWIVRYQIRSGPPAHLEPGGGPVAEVATNESGQAAVEVVEDQAVAGTSSIGVEIVKSGVLDSVGRPLVVGRATTHVTWSSPGLSLRKTGPTAAAIGDLLQYRIEVTNPGDLPAADVVVSDRLPAGVSLQKSDPPTQPSASSGELRWPLGTLASGETRVIQLYCKADRPGRIENIATATAHGGIRATSSAVTEVGSAGLQLRLKGPASVNVGQTVQFTIEITNRGNTPLPGLVLKAKFDPGLRHAVAPSPIERDLGQVLQPGETQQVTVEFEAVQAGQHCVEIQAISGGAVLASARECVRIEQRGAPSPPVSETIPPGGVSPGIGAAPSRPPTTLQLRVLGPERARVGEMVEFVIDLSNVGAKPVEGVQLTCRVDAALVPRFASGGFEPRRPGEVVAPFVWRRDSIAPNQTVQYRLQCVAQKAAPQACLSVEAATSDGAQLSERRCVAIEEAAGTAPTGAIAPQKPGVSVGDQISGKRVTDSSSPTGAPSPASAIEIVPSFLRSELLVGQRGTLVVKVTNAGLSAQTNVELRIRLPGEVQAVKFGTFGPAGAEDASFEAGLVRFPPLRQLSPGSSVEYRLAFQAAKPGTAEFVVELTTVASSTPQVAKVSLTIRSGS
ncbi:MAG: DUF11 domain-containing protein [Thermoguttaceae bacterium]|nr:DUF11 domain-containing protein [Thermoguttaceae bacterium]MDW8077523.1 DUF11 domain-containing protein [Thermoguttaceae bacterium]